MPLLKNPKFFVVVRVIIFVVVSVSVLAVVSVKATDYSSSNYNMINVNLGEQPFISVRNVSPPAVTGPGPEVIESTPYSVKIKWFTDRAANSIVAYGTVSGSYPQEISKATEYTTEHIVDITGLTPKTTYYYKAKSTDLFGNVGQSEERSFTTPLPIPKISNITVIDITSDSAKINFETDYFTTAVVEYVSITDLSKKTVGETGYSKEHQILLSDLTDDTSYSFRVIARDDEGNETSSSITVFTTDKDRTPPTISSMKFDVSPINGTSRTRIIASWKTDEPSTSQIKFGEGAKGQKESETAPDSVLATSHIVTLVNLKPQTTYKLYALSVDKAGNVGQSGEFMVLTPKQKKTIFQIILENLQEIFKPFARLFR